MMNIPIKQLTTAVLELEEEERAHLAHILITSIDGHTYSHDELDMKLKKRVDQIKNVQVIGVPAETVFAKRKEKYH